MEANDAALLGTKSATAAEEADACEAIAAEARLLAGVIDWSNQYVAQEFEVRPRSQGGQVTSIRAMRLATKHPLYLGFDGEIYRRYEFTWRFMGLVKLRRPHLMTAEYHLRDLEGLLFLLARIRSDYRDFTDPLVD